MSKKKIILVVASLCMVAALAIGGTIAYFTDTDKATNTFTVGNIDIEVTEDCKVTDAAGNELTDKVAANTDGGYDFTNIMAGNKIAKPVTVTNTGANDAYVRVIVLHNNYIEINKAIDDVYENVTGSTEAMVQAKVDEVFDGWDLVHAHVGGDVRYICDRATGTKLLKVDMSYVPGVNSLFSINNMFKSAAETASHDYSLDASEGGYQAGYYTANMAVGQRAYIYYLYLKPNESYQCFNGINCPADFTQAQAAMFNGLKINVYADAIQTESFADAKTAFEALEVAHPMSTFVNN